MGTPSTPREEWQTRNPVNLTKTAINKLLPASKDYFVAVEDYQGLNIRVLSNGAKVFVLRYRFQGVQHKHTLGTYPAMTPEIAKEVWRAKWTEISRGKELNEAKAEAKKARQEEKRNRVTVAELAEKFIHDYLCVEVIWREKGKTKKRQSFEVEPILAPDGRLLGRKHSTAREYVRILHHDVLPELGTKAVKEVDSSDIAGLLLNIRKHAPTHSNRVKAVLSKMFAKAVTWKLRPDGSNPARDQDRFNGEVKKERNLNDRELVALGKGLKAVEASTRPAGSRRKKGEIRREEPPALAAIRLLLLTGMRKGELIGDRYRGIPAATWADWHQDEAVLMVAHKTQTRTGKKRIIHLCEAAQAILQDLHDHHQTLGNLHIIPGEVAGESMVNLQLVWDRIKEAVAIQVPQADLSDVTLHDLRRTFSSVGARMGYPELWLGALLGHSAGTVTQGYARVGGDPLHEAAEAIGARIVGLLDGTINPDQEAEDRVKARDAKAKKA